jgi:hypothetical protein
MDYWRRGHQPMDRTMTSPRSRAMISPLKVQGRRALGRVVLALVAALLAAAPAPPAVAEREPFTSAAPASSIIPIAPARRLPLIGGPPATEVHFVPNTFRFWDDPRFATTTDPPKPAYADVITAPSNFLPCQGGPFALCYYSGPDGPPASEDLGCRVSEDGRFADCRCYEIPYGPYYVLNTAILNYAIYLETVEACGLDGSACGAPNSAPVCDYINENRFIPGADLISTFSFDCVPTDGLGSTSCSPPSAPPYAGCMTAPCQRTDEAGIVECSCPVFDGPYQVGQSEVSCDLGDDLVWSAAYNPAGPTFPTPPSCIPDAPGTVGCPLYDPGTTVLPPGTDCAAICEAYACSPDGDIEPGYTCDATLCTNQCNDRDLVAVACSALPQCPKEGTAAILALEAAAGCSCCASQLCGCAPNAATDAAVFELNQQQRAHGITPQCDVNGTLCGAAE